MIINQSLIFGALILSVHFSQKMAFATGLVYTDLRNGIG